MKKSFKKYEKAGLPGGPNELKRFTQGFIVSERGQWDYPGLPTAVPTPTGKITMKGVEDDLLGIDNLGNAQYMTPGNEYQFEGDMVYEIPQAKKGGSKKYSKKYSRSLMARNILFTKNPLFKKSKSVKNKIFDPNSPYFASGGEIISFDFDDTLSTDRGLQMAQSIPNEKYIISARAEVTPDMIERARAAGISEDRIFATGSDKAKIAKIKELGINIHIDNKQSVINKLGSAGQIFQAGGENGPGNEVEKQRQWLISYLRSPMYKERLKKEFPGKDDNFINNEANIRLNNLLSTKINYVPSIGVEPGWISGLYVPKQYKGQILENKKWVSTKWEKDPIHGYDKKGNIYLESEYNPNSWYPSSGFETTPLHEMGHAIDDGGFRIPVQTEKKIFMYTGAPDEYSRYQYLNNGKPFYYTNKPSEFINRIQPIRYLLNEQNIYDTRKKEFTESDYNKMMKNPKIIEDVNFQDVMNTLKGDKKKAFIDIMNTIALQENGELLEASYGYSVGNLIRKQDGGITKLSPEEEIEFQKFYATLPENLQTDDATYDIRGYWDSEGRPEKFNYDQPKESDGYYHAYSINSNTGEYLKSPVHETFQHAVDEDRKIGYRPITNVYGRNIATENSSLADSDAQSFLRNMIGAPSYIELELDDSEIEEYRKGGYIVEDISVPSLTKAKNGKQTTGIDPAFQAKAQQVANNIGVPLEDLLGIMRHESGLNPGAVNPYTNATGLIQFMPNTARKLGTSIEALKNMSAIEQLDYVEKFYKPIAGKAKDIGDLYMFTFLPAAVGKPNNFVIGASGSSNKVFGINQNALYKQNKNFDADKKGYYTVGDVKNRISKTSGRPLIGSSDQSIPGFESSTSRTPGEKTVVKTTIIKDMQNDDWKPGKEEEQVDPRIEQLKAFTKIIEPSLQNINNIYAAAMQQKRFGGNTRMFQDGGMLEDEQDQLLNKPGYGAIGVSGSSPVPEYLQPSDVTWYGTPRQMVTAPKEFIYRSPVTGRLQSGQYDPNANQEQLADAATNIIYADVAQGRAESTTPTEEIKLSDRVIKSGNYLKGLKSVKPIKGLARPKGEFYTKEEYEKSDKDKLAKSGYYAVKLKDGNYELLKKEDISNMILARGITPDQFSKNYKIGNSESITKDFKPVYDYAQQLQAQRVGPMIDQLIYSGKSVDQAIKALVAKGEDTYEGIKQKYGEYAKTIKKDADKIYAETLEANKKKEQANQQGLEVNYEKKQRLEEDLLIQNYLNQDTKGLSESQRKTLLNLAISQKERTDRLNSEIDKAQRESAAGFGSGTRDATATQAYPSRNPYSEATATIQRLGQEKANAAYAANVAKYVITDPKLTEEDRRNILSDPDEFNKAAKAYNEFQNKELKKELKKQLEADEMLGRVYKPQYQSGIASMVYPEWLAIGPSGWLKEAGSGLLRGVNAINKIGLNDLLPATITNNYLTSLGLSLAEREALASKLAPFTVGNILTAESAARIGTEYIPNIIEGKNVGRNVAETVVSALPLYKPASSIGAINYGRSLFNADKYGIKAYQHPDDIKSDFKLLKAISTLTGHQDGGMVMDLSDKEIDEYRKGGWIVEEID